jgi:hypothetical protein
MTMIARRRRRRPEGLVVGLVDVAIVVGLLVVTFWGAAWAGSFFRSIP